MPRSRSLTLAATIAVGGAVFAFACRNRTTAGLVVTSPPSSAAIAPAPPTTGAMPAVRPALPVAPNPAEHWRGLLAQPSSIGRDAELAVTLEELAGRDPPAAAEMLRALPDGVRRSVVGALFTDSAHRPERALQLAAQFVAADPERSRDHGHSLVYVLTTAGEYESAVRFALLQNANGGESEDPVEWLKAAFRAWAAAQPEVAAAQVFALPGTMREEALQAVAGSWAQTAPLAALEFVQRLPLESERRTGFEAALRTWGESDPAAAASWLGQFEPNHDFDYPIARLAGNDRFVERPDEGLALAGRIVDPELRSHVVAQLLKRLAAKDPQRALQQAQSNGALLADDKAAVLAAANRPPD